MKRRKKGYTLIELVIVIAVVGILAGTALVAYDRSKRRSEYRAMRANVHALTAAVKGYFYTLQAYCVTSTSDRTNRAYGTNMIDGNFCRYRVYLSSGNPRVRVSYFPSGCTNCNCAGVTYFYFYINGSQQSCTGPNCMTD